MFASMSGSSSTYAGTECSPGKMESISWTTQECISPYPISLEIGIIGAYSDTVGTYRTTETCEWHPEATNTQVPQLRQYALHKRNLL